MVYIEFLFNDLIDWKAHLKYTWIFIFYLFKWIYFYKRTYEQFFFHLINCYWYTKIYHNHHILDWKRDLEPRAESDALDRKPTNGEQNKIFHSTHRSRHRRKKVVFEFNINSCVPRQRFIASFQSDFAEVSSSDLKGRINGSKKVP